MALIPAIAVGVMAAALAAVILFPRIVLPRFDGEVIYDEAANQHFDIPDLPQFTFGSQPLAAPTERPRHTVRRTENTPPDEPTTKNATTTTNENKTRIAHQDSSFTDGNLPVTTRQRRMPVLKLFGFLFGRRQPDDDVENSTSSNGHANAVRPLGVDEDDARGLLRPLGFDESDAQPVRPMRARRAAPAEPTTLEAAPPTTLPPAEPAAATSAPQPIQPVKPAEPAPSPVFVNEANTHETPSVQPVTQEETLGSFFRRRRPANGDATITLPSAAPTGPISTVAQTHDDATKPSSDQTQGQVSVPGPQVEAKARGSNDNKVIPLRTDRVFEWTKSVGVNNPLDLGRRRRLMKMQSAMKSERARTILQQIIDEDPELANEAQALLNGSAATG